MLSIIVFLISVLFIVVAGTRFKLHPFLTLLSAAFLFGLCSGMPLDEIIDSITSGFGGTLGNIGMIIIAGIIIGAFLENSGGAQTLANFVLKIVGTKRLHTAMGVIGFIVSIPVFADSGFVILSSLNKALSKKAKLSLAGTAVALSLGLTASHTMVPPTPGPIAAAGIIEADLGLVILLGIVTSIVGLIICLIFSKYIGKRIHIDPDFENRSGETGEITLYRPSLLKSLLPILIPIMLIVLRSVSEFPTHPFGEGRLKMMLDFVGHPVVALFIGVLFSFMLPKKFNREMLSSSGWVGDALKSAAIIILITGAGGAFGKVLQNSEIVAVLGDTITDSGLGLWLPFFIAAAIKTAQGSSTVAIVTAASIVLPLLGYIGVETEMSKAMVVIAIGSGAAVVSHANDSFFWVITQMSGMNIRQGYQTHSLGTVLFGFTTMIFLTCLNIFL